MAKKTKATFLIRWLRARVSTAFAGALGVGGRRKLDLYLDLSRAATLKDLVYWLQIIFAAGIATLGLVLNSPAVIIGAMLISPLMNAILASGLALASGDLVLGLRAGFNLILSCAAAILFAVILVVALPFREMTAEIAARTQPNVLDLLIALFSGAVGSVAICREVKGVVTSIPGVAIAVALMPPLCVVGYGIGLMIVLDVPTGWRVATGGGLLFLTNLIAITLTAMLVFLALRIDTPKVCEQVTAWEKQDAESSFVIGGLRRFPGIEKARVVHSFPLRAAMILVPLALILFPLSSAFSQLSGEIAKKQRESEIRQAVTDVWQKNFQHATDGAARSSIDHLNISETGDKLNVNLRVFDDEPYSLEEKKRCAELVAARLNRPAETVNLKLTEVPTVSALESVERTREEPTAPTAPTFAELRESFAERVAIALSDFKLSAPAQILRRQITAEADAPAEVKIVYLSDAPLAAETETGLADKIRQSLGDAKTNVSFERVPANVGEIAFDRRAAALSVAGMMQLEFAGRMLRENPKLVAEINFPTAAATGATEAAAKINAEQFRAIADYLSVRWQIAPARVKQSAAASAGDKTSVGLQIADQLGADALTASVAR